MDDFERGVVDFVRNSKGVAINMTRDRAAADDLLQTVALKALKSRHQFQVGTNLNAWLYMILRNAHFSRLRGVSGKRETSALDDVPEHMTSAPAAQDDMVEVSRAMLAIGALCPSQCWALIGIAEGLSYDEVAILCGGVSVGTVKSRLHRARLNVREALS